MKNILTALLLSCLIWSCTDPKKQEKELLDKVIAVHDKVMAKESQLMKNKMQLDTMLKAVVVPDAKQSMTNMIRSLDSTDANMEDWMHKFDAENKGKSHEEIMTYLTDQQLKIDTIAKHFDAAITASDTYIKSQKK